MKRKIYYLSIVLMLFASIQLMARGAQKGYSIDGETISKAGTANPVGYWKMDDGTGTTVTDEIGLSDGTLINAGASIWVDGYIGKAIDITSFSSPDTSVFLQISGDEFNFTSTESFSISVILKLDKTTATEQSVFSKGNPFLDNGGWYHFSYKDQAARFMVWDESTLSSPEGVFPENFPDNDWVHIVCVKDAEEDLLKVYLNGVLLDYEPDATTGEIANDGDLYIGTVPEFGTDCNGAIDEVMIFDVALTDDEVLNMSHEYGFSPISKVSPVGYWKMDDGTGTIVTDEVGLSDGTLINAGASIWIDGYIGKAIDIQSFASEDTSVFVQIPGAEFSFTSAESFSFSMITKLDNTSGTEQSVLSKGNPFLDGGGWYHFSYKDDAARFMVWDQATLSSPSGTFPENFPDNDWVHLVCVKDADTLKVYLNGVLLDSGLDATTGEIANNGDLYIGTVPEFGTDCKGLIDEVMIFDVALTDEEILNMSREYGFSEILPSNIIGYWKMDNGHGLTVSDEVGISDGKLINAGTSIWVDGYIGKAIDIQSFASEDTSVFVQIPGAEFSFTSAESFSFSMITKLDNTSGNEQSVLSKGNPFLDGGGWYHFSYKEDAARFMVWDQATLSSPIGTFPAAFPDNDWVNLVCVKDVDTLKVYLNGILLDKGLDATTGEIANNGDLYIGTVPEFGTDCRGIIDEVIIFNEALSSEEILTLAEDYGFDPILFGTDASLSDLQVDGVTVDGFDPDVISYDVELTAGTTDVPVVTATTTDAAASLVVNEASALPGSTTVDVTAEDGTMLIYIVNFTVAPDGIELNTISNFNIYPNPVHYELTVNSDENSIISIYELNGMLLKTFNSNDIVTRIDVSDLEAGIYFIKVKTLDGIALATFIKQ